MIESWCLKYLLIWPTITSSVMKRLRQILFVAFTLLLPWHAQASSDKKEPSKAEKRIFELLNLERKEAGLKPLEWNQNAAVAARAHARLLADNRDMSHQFPGEPALRERLTATTVRFTSAGENVAKADDPDEVHLALMGSPGHRANILGADYTAVGVGVVERDGRLYVAQDFIRLVPVYTEEQFLQTFTASLNHARAARQLAQFTVRQNQTLHDAACSTQGKAQALPVDLGFAGEIVVFNLSEPESLPAELLQRAVSPRWRNISVGVCFRPDPKHGDGNFWVVAALGE
jgi:uncharacterized protein YkwD